MKILYISHLHPPDNQPLESIGGMQKVSVELVNTLEAKEDVELATIIQKSSWKDIVSSTISFLVSLLTLIPEKVEEFNPDVILFSSMVTAGITPFLSKEIKVPKVTINHGQDVTLPFWIYQKYIPYVFQRLDGVISVSRATRQACIDRGLDPQKAVVLPNGMNFKENPGLSSEKAKKIISEVFDFNFENKPLLLTVGRQVKRKGHSWFIRKIMPYIKTNCNYLVIGDGPEFGNIRKVALQSENRNCIYLAGRQSDSILRQAYAAADLFIMPNIPVPGDMEGFGIVLLEANQASVPAIASDLEGIRDVIEQGVNGYRVPFDEPEKFASRIDKVLHNNLGELSNRTKLYVEQKFSWNSVVDQYLEYLGKVTANNNQREFLQ